MRFYGLTHYVPCWDWMLKLWAKVLCKKNWHLFDEVSSGDRNYLSCDACGLVVNIESIDTQYMDV